MELIRKTKKEKNKYGGWTYYAIFWCDFCKQEVERPLSYIKCKSCGCNRYEFMKENKWNIKHDGTGTKVYRLWSRIKERCYSLKKDNYKYYGGRGITICDEWKNDFIKFRAWCLNNGYADNLVIDRKNPNGNYEPNNCRFLTIEESNRNRRTVKFNMQKANEIRELYNTKNYTQKELAEKYNVSRPFISLIINNKNWVNKC